MRARVLGVAAALAIALVTTMAASKAMADDSDAEKCLFRRHYVVGYPGWGVPVPVVPPYYVTYPRPYYPPYWNSPWVYGYNHPYHHHHHGYYYR